ncbi:MAG: hypothetical protein LBB93_03420 [Elusimicrobiota bacterium]|jgi:hypothetical protein|nr:hypothetical protein [Elusimicrobiota bacterium]
MKKSILFIVFAVSISVLATSCGGPKVLGSKDNAVVLTVVETIPNVSAPKWVESTSEFWEDGGNYYYRGLSEGMTNIEAARRAAQASAVTQIAEQIKSVVRVEFSRALQGGAYDDTTGAYLKDVFFSVVDNLSVSGAVVKETYSQRLNESNKTNGTSRTYYRSYSLAQISAADYKNLVANAFDQTKNQVKANDSAKELSDAVEQRFFQTQAQAADQAN